MCWAPEGQLSCLGRRASGTLTPFSEHPANFADSRSRSEASEKPKQVVSRFPRPRKGPNKLFEGFRGLGKAQTGCFKVSEASEKPKQVVSRFPRARKGSNRLFEGFRGLGSLYPENFADLRRGSEACTRKTSPASAEASRARKPVPGKLRRPPQRPRGLGSLYPSNFAGLRRGPEGSEKGCMCVKERLSIILLINKGSKRKTHTRRLFVLFSIAVST